MCGVMWYYIIYDLLYTIYYGKCEVWYSTIVYMVLHCIDCMVLYCMYCTIVNIDEMVWKLIGITI